MITSATPLSNTTSTTTNASVMGIFSSYNSQDNQYGVVWAGADNKVYLDRYHEDGSLIGNTTPISTGISETSFISYNTQSNQFFITWPNSFTPYFAIYNADGTTFISATTLNTAGKDIWNSIYSSYNKQMNQFFLSWADDTQIAYYALYNIDGSISGTVNQIPLSNNTTQVNANIYSSYNSTSDTVAFSWLGQNSVPTDLGGFFTIYQGPLVPNPNPSIFHLLEGAVQKYPLMRPQKGL